MFEPLALRGSQEVEIQLSTRRNRPIRNAQAPSEIPQRHRERHARQRRQHPDWSERKPLSGVYNCFGHVWASRRTAIYEQSEIDKIIEDDGYRDLRDNESPMQGDLALYFLGAALMHVGQVCELRSFIGDVDGRIPPTPWVLSKWDDTSAEVLHQLRDTPWPEQIIKFVTERP